MSDHDSVLIDGLEYSIGFEFGESFFISVKNKGKATIQVREEFASILQPREPSPRFVEVKIEGLTFKQSAVEQVWYNPLFSWSGLSFEDFNERAFVLPGAEMTVRFPMECLFFNIQRAVSEEEHARIIDGNIVYSVRFKIGDKYIELVPRRAFFEPPIAQR